MLVTIVTRILAFLLIAEAMFAGLRLAGLVPQLAAYDAVAVALILARGLLGALQFAGGWMIASRRAQGLVLGQWAFIGGALLTLLDVGLNLAPTDVYPWYRWHVTVAYGLYAAVGWQVLHHARRA
jgi:hypothetical protein